MKPIIDQIVPSTTPEDEAMTDFSPAKRRGAALEKLCELIVRFVS
jgi:hypothetical protein